MNAKQPLRDHCCIYVPATNGFEGPQGNLRWASHTHTLISTCLCSRLRSRRQRVTLVPDTLYQVPGTLHLVPGTWYQAPGSRHLVPVPGTTYQVPATRYLVPVTWYLVPGTWHHIPKSLYQVPAARYQVRSIRCLVLSTWDQAPIGGSVRLM